MWILKDILIMLGLVIMAMIFVVNTIGTAFDIQQIRHEIVYWGLSWFELLSFIFTAAFLVVVIRLISRLNKYERAKPILPNRQELFTAIHHLSDTARETIWRNDAMRNQRDIGVDYSQELTDYGTAYTRYWEAEKQLDLQTAVAGQPFTKSLTAFKNTIKMQVFSRELPNIPSYSQTLEKLGEIVRELEAEIDAISQ